MGSRKFQITFGAHIIFLLHGVVLKARNSMCKGPVAGKELHVFSTSILSLHVDIYLVMLLNLGS